MAKVYDFLAECKWRQRKARMVDILETAMLMVKKNEVDGLVVVARKPRETGPIYPFARENLPNDELDLTVKMAKEKGL